MGQWLSGFLGKWSGQDAIKKAFSMKLKTPDVKPAEDINEDYEFDTTPYLKEQERKEGFEDQIKAGGKKKKLAGKSYLGV